jgi:hypothetical protein
MPNGGLIFDTQGNLSGTMQTGGKGCPPPVALDGCGVVFRLSPPSSGTGQWTESVLYAFSGGADGAFPSGLLIDSAGNRYGTVMQGGDATAACSPSGCGLVFELSPPSSGSGPWTETVLHTFTRAVPGNVIFDSSGNLYGATAHGGSAAGQAGNGVVFELVPSS